MYDVIEGRGRLEAVTLSDRAIGAWGEMTARLGRATRGFFHPRAQRTMLWDVQHTAASRALLPDVRDPEQRALAERVLDRFDEVVAPMWPTLRAQVVHGDLTVDNALVDDDGMIQGIMDFGDMSHSALVIDVASVLDSLLVGRESPEERFRIARLVMDGYQRVTPFEPDELAMMGELLAARCAVTVAISSWRVARGLEEADFAGATTPRSRGRWPPSWTLGWDETRRPLERRGADGEPRRPPDRGAGAGDGAAHLHPPDRDGERPRRMDDRHGRPHVPGRVQQRAVRRARAPTGDGGGGQAVAGAEHEHALPASARRSSSPSD